VEFDAVATALAERASAADAVHLQRFFKTGPGEYGEGQVFIGVRVPAIRAVVAQFRDTDPSTIDDLLDSEIHEHRMAGLLLLVRQYPRDSQRVVLQYRAAMDRGCIDNWDLVDCSAEYILGEWLFERDRSELFEWAESPDLWMRRIAMITTFGFIRHGDASTTLELAPLLFDDEQDLIHKAVGWMLREVGKRVDPALLVAFLDEHATRMPRTALRYAVEHLDPETRASYVRKRP
jgi:3-methyladenine DNA glycosylase AlkD